MRLVLKMIPLIIWIFCIQLVCCTDCFWVAFVFYKMGGLVDTDDCCNMSGIMCKGTSVVAIKWDNQGLVGKIPSEIGNLKGLKWM